MPGSWHMAGGSTSTGFLAGVMALNPMRLGDENFGDSD
jgi:hypothetical protein